MGFKSIVQKGNKVKFNSDRYPIIEFPILPLLKLSAVVIIMMSFPWVSLKLVSGDLIDITLYGAAQGAWCNG